MGTALLEIRDSRLYRETHSTFENYCRDRWGMNRRYANRIIEAAVVVENLGPIGPKLPSTGTDQLVSLPTHESQARPLAKLEPEQQRTAGGAV